MSTTHVESIGVPSMRLLDAEAASRVLCSAARLQALVHLFRSTDLTHADLEGTLMACEDDVLRLRLIVKRWDGQGGCADFHGRLMDTPACFHFETRLLDPLPRLSPAMLRLARPDTIRVEERRATARRQFRDEITVKLWGIGGAAHQPCAAAMLNFSAGGLACRVTGAPSGAFIAGSTVRLAFLPDGLVEAGEINLAARIVSVTTASAPDVVILGLEFDQELLGKTGRARIEAALARRL